MNALVASVIRTLVPAAVAQIATWALLLNITLPPAVQTSLSTFLGFALTAVYFVGVRVLEQQWPAFGILLGLAASPDTYSKGTPATAAVSAAPTVNPAPVADILAPAKTFPAAAVDAASGAPEVPSAPVETAPIVGAAV